MKGLIISSLTIITWMLYAACNHKEKVDLIVYDAHIYTMDEGFRTATTMVVHQGKILAIGGDSLLSRYESSKLLKSSGKIVYPGFIDAHCHYTGFAQDNYKLKLFGTRSFKELVDTLLSYTKVNKRKWIEGTGWDQHDWVDKSFPNKDTLDLLFPHTPIFLLRIDGHAALVNQKALDLAGITNQTKMNGGEIGVSNGRLSGIIIDNAIDLVRKKLPVSSKEESIASFAKVQQDFFSKGLTSIVECGVNKQIVEWLDEAQKKQIIQLRVSLMLNAVKENESFLSQKPYKSERLHVAGFKIFADGALGSRGAKLIMPYTDRPHHHGAMLLSPDSLDAFANKTIHSPYQLCTHAIGDATNRQVLEIYAKYLKSNNDRRWRIEHAQLVQPTDMHLFHDFSIVPSVQPTHAISDMTWVQERIGHDRMPFAYAYKELLQQNGWLPLGTDFPVEDINPLHTFCAAVFRINQQLQPKGGFQVNNALLREEALRGMTIWAAKSVFEEKEKGSLEVGKYADFIIMTTDLMKASAAEIYKTNIEATYIDGEKVYGK